MGRLGKTFRKRKFCETDFIHSDPKNDTIACYKTKVDFVSNQVFIENKFKNKVKVNILNHPDSVNE